MWELTFGLLFLGAAVASYIYRNPWIKEREQWFKKYFPNKGGRSRNFVRFDYHWGTAFAAIAGIGLIALGAFEVFK